MNKCVVKISVSSETDYYHIDDVVYFRSGMSPDFLERWLWYFEYLSARIKTANPHRKVELYKGPQDIMLGQEWHNYRRGVLIKTRKSKLNKILNEFVHDDLFHFALEDHDKKINDIQSQLDSLESDSFPIPEFPEYINKLHDYL